MDMTELTEYFSQEETMALTDVLIERDKQIKLEGAQAARATIARTMLQKQMSIADIAEITGLSIEQVQQLQTQN
jgi:predicted transposase/invertase (TIGR01784 family)